MCDGALRNVSVYSPFHLAHAVCRDVYGQFWMYSSNGGGRRGTQLIDLCSFMNVESMLCMKMLLVVVST